MAGVAKDILVVEDDGLQREALTVLLEGEGYRVATAVDGRDALVQLRARPGFCVILLDMMMPGMDGWQFRAEQVGDPALAAVPVIMISADGAAVATAAAAGVAAALLKPVDVDRLLHLVACHCRCDVGAAASSGTPPRRSPRPGS